MLGMGGHPLGSQQEMCVWRRSVEAILTQTIDSVDGLQWFRAACLRTTGTQQESLLHVQQQVSSIGSLSGSLQLTVNQIVQQLASHEQMAQQLLQVQQRINSLSQAQVRAEGAIATIQGSGQQANTALQQLLPGQQMLSQRVAALEQQLQHLATQQRDTTGQLEQQLASHQQLQLTVISLQQVTEDMLSQQTAVAAAPAAKAKEPAPAKAAPAKAAPKPGEPGASRGAKRRREDAEAGLSGSTRQRSAWPAWQPSSLFWSRQRVGAPHPMSNVTSSFASTKARDKGGRGGRGSKGSS